MAATTPPPIIRAFLGGAWNPFFSGSACRDAPHLGQCSAPAGTASPHLGQKDAPPPPASPPDSWAPQEPQNAAPSGSSFPHLGHVAIFILLLKITFQTKPLRVRSDGPPGSSPLRPAPGGSGKPSLFPGEAAAVLLLLYNILAIKTICWLHSPGFFRTFYKTFLISALCPSPGPAPPRRIFPAPARLAPPRSLHRFGNLSGKTSTKTGLFSLHSGKTVI